MFALCVGGDEPEYQDVDWQLGDNPVCLHRIAVRPDRGGRGYGRLAVDVRQGVPAGKRRLRLLPCGHLRGEYARVAFFRSVTAREAGTFRLEGFDKLYHCFESSCFRNASLLRLHSHQIGLSKERLLRITATA